MKNELRDIVDLIKEKTGQTQEEIAFAMGYKKNYISEILSPSGKVTDKFMKAIKLRFSDTLGNKGPKAFAEDKTRIEREDQPTHSSDKEGLFNLIHSVRIMAENNRTVVESNKLLVETNRDLAQRALTGDFDEEKWLAVFSTFEGFRDVLIEVSAKVKKVSKQAAAAELGRRVNTAVGKARKADTHFDDHIGGKIS